MTALWVPAELITASKLNKGLAFHVASLTALRAVNTTLYTEDNLPFFVDGVGVFLYKIAGSGSDDGINTIIPTVGSGAFIKLRGGGFTQTFADGTALKAFDTTNLSSGLYYEAQINQLGRTWKYFWVSSGSPVLAEPYNYDATTGPGYWALLSRDAQSFIPSDNQVFVNQSSHGFSALNTIRDNGTNWVKAQANTEDACVDTWVVSTVIDANNFAAVKIGRVTVASHGLTPGTLYYLSAASAGAITATKPVGSTTVPLGFYLPVIYAVDANTIDVLGQARATYNPLLAEYVVGGSNVDSGVTFSNLAIASMGKSVQFVYAAGGAPSSGTNKEINIRINGVSSGAGAYESRLFFSDGATITPNSSTSSSTGRISFNSASTGTGVGIVANGEVMLQAASGEGVYWTSNFFIESNVHGNGGGRLTQAQTDITSIQFHGSYRFVANSGNYVRLYRRDF